MFIFAKDREVNVKIVQAMGSHRTGIISNYPTNRNHNSAVNELTSARESAVSEFGLPLTPSPKSNRCFIRPEQSFIAFGRGPIVLSSLSRRSLPHWAKDLLPLPRTTPLSTIPVQGDRGSESNAAAAATSPSLPDSNQHEESSSDVHSNSEAPTLNGTSSSREIPLESGVKKSMRYACRTCSERLPTLNSLRTHLKSHCRPLVPQQSPQLSVHSICMQSQVVTSKYGRRRPVISAKKPPPRCKQGVGEKRDAVVNGF